MSRAGLESRKRKRKVARTQSRKDFELPESPLRLRVFKSQLGWEGVGTTMVDSTNQMTEMPLEDCMDAIIDYRGKTPKKTDAGIPLVTAKIIKGGRIEEPAEFIAPAEYDTWMRRGIPEPGDVVLTTEAPLGEVAQLDDRKVALAQRVITLRGKAELLDNTFLKYLLISDPIQARLKSRASGTTVLGIKQSELRKVKLTFPPLPEQRAIASILGALDDKIELNRRMNATLESLARAIFKSWFVDFDPVHVNAGLALTGQMPASSAIPTTHDPKVLELFPSTFQDSGIPEGWTTTPLSDMTETNITYGVVKPGPTDDENGVLFIRGGDIKNGRVMTDDLRTITREVSKQYERTLLRGGEVVVSLVGNPGEVAIVPTELEAANIARQVGLVRIRKECSNLFVKFFLSSKQGQESLRVRSLGSVQKVINLRDLKQFTVTDPGAELISLFHERVASIQTQMDANVRESASLATTRDALLPTLLSGELPVLEPLSATDEVLA